MPSTGELGRAERFFCGDRVLVDGTLQEAAVGVRGENIVWIGDRRSVTAGAPLLDAGPCVLMPALVDTHVHINEPGRTEWEGFSTATRAALEGGIGTLIDMPLNSIPPTTTASGLAAKVQAAEGKLWVDVGFCGGFVRDNRAQLSDLAREGVFAFKSFLCDSGVPEFPHVDSELLNGVAAVLARTGRPLFVHAEAPAPLERAMRTLHPAAGADARRYASWLSQRPADAEDEAVATLIELARAHQLRTHVVHLSSASALQLLRVAKHEAVPLSAETCPHYLALAAEAIEDGQTQFKCAPPIRGEANQAALWDGLRQGLVDAVVSDHSPCVPELKRLASYGGDGDFGAAWGGIATLGLGLPVVWTQAHARGVGLATVIDRMARQSANLVGLSDRGRIEVGCRADFVVFDDAATWVLRPEDLRFRNPVSPYVGQSLRGRVEQVVLGGTLRFSRNAPQAAGISDRPQGRVLLKRS